SAEPFRVLVDKLLKEEPQILSVEVLRRARLDGYQGGKSALYSLAASLRPRHVKLVMRFEGLPGEFSQHDFGQVKITFLDGSCRIVHFFASRLKWSRWVEVTLVENEVVETLVRELAEHFTRFEGVPLCAVFDRPKTVALHWGKDGEVTEWNSTFAYAALELGFTAEVCWPHQPQQKGAVENLVGWVKGSFFKQRRFHDMEDLSTQLLEWLQEVNTQRPSRATGHIPLERMVEERRRLRPLKIPASELALRIPVQVGPTAEVFYDGRGYAMPPEAAGLPGTLYLYRNRVKIVAGRWQAEHERFIAKGQVARLPEHRAAHLAAVAGKRGKRYLKRQNCSSAVRPPWRCSPRSCTVALAAGTRRSINFTSCFRAWAQRRWSGRAGPRSRRGPSPWRSSRSALDRLMAWQGQQRGSRHERENSLSAGLRC